MFSPNLKFIFFSNCILVNKSLIWANHENEIIIIVDCSTDGTTEILNKLSNVNTQIINHKINFGKGTVLECGFKYLSWNLLIIQDADPEYDPSEYPIQIKPIEENKADVVDGSIFVGRRSPKVFFLAISRKYIFNFAIQYLY